MSTIVTNTSVFTNRSLPFDKIDISQLEKRNRKYYIDYTIENLPIFLQINKVKLISEPIFIDDEQGYIDIQIQDRLSELAKFFQELDDYNQLICYKHSEEWLGKSLELSEVEKVYKSSFKENVLRLKIEKESISMYDMKKNKLSIDSDLKIGDTLDVIMELSGLKLMKSAFSTYIVLRQIRKHPEPIIKKKSVPNEYLFLDEYSNRQKTNIQDDNSLDDQTDVEMLAKKKVTPKTTNSKPKIPINELMGGTKVKSINEDESIKSASIDSNIKRKTKNTKKEETTKKEEISVSEFVDIPNDYEETTKDYLDNIMATMNNKSNEIEDSSEELSKNSKVSQNNVSEIQSRKDLILDALENGDIALGSMVSSVKSVKVSKKKLNPSKKSTSKLTDEQLHKNI